MRTNTDFAALAERTLIAAAIATRTAPITWVVEATFLTPQDTTGRLIVVVDAPLSERPDAETLIPAGCELTRDVSFPAVQFADMANETRDRYRAHYRAYLTFMVAKARGKKVNELICGTDYEPDAIDDQVVAWSRFIPARRVA
jgi:hypothetical protein